MTSIYGTVSGQVKPACPCSAPALARRRVICAAAGAGAIGCAPRWPASSSSTAPWAAHGAGSASSRACRRPATTRRPSTFRARAPTPLRWPRSLCTRYADAVCDALERMDGPVLLTGHSMGGMVITQAASQHPEKLAGLVYVAAFLPQPGQSLIDITHLPEAAGDSVQANIVVEGDPPVATMPPEAAPEALYHCCTAGAGRLGAAATRQSAGDPLHPSVHAGRRHPGRRRAAARLRHVPAGPGDPPALQR